VKVISELTAAANFKKILIVQTAFIGDVILITPLIRVLAENYPKTEIHFMTIPASRNTVETLPYIDRLWIYDKRGTDAGLANLVKFGRTLKKEQFDLAIVPHRSLRSAFLVYLAGIPRRIGFDRSSGAFLFTDAVPYSAPVHEIERNFRLLNPLNIQISGRQLPDIHPDFSDREIISEWMINQGIDVSGNLVCLAPGSIWPTKRWPPDYWAKLTAKFKSEKWTVIFIGSKTDKTLINDIINMTESRVYDASGLFTIRQSADIIRRCRLLISNDSAPTHMGNAVRTPVLTIFGCTVPAFGFFPFGLNDRVAEVHGLSCRPCTDHGRNKCPLKHFKCMLDLTPDMVFDIAWKMIHERHQN